MREGKQCLILAINPGSTSTKAALFENGTQLALQVIRHSPDDFRNCTTLMDQKDIRMKSIMEMIGSYGIGMDKLDAVVGRGGLTKPIPSGTYGISRKMLDDLSTGFASTHPSSLGPVIAHEIGEKHGVPSYVVDPVVVDEKEPIARISGIPQITRRSISHALNAKAVARRVAADLGKKYENCRFVVAHMGGGVSVAAHRYGRMIDVNDALYGEGPFSPERCGGLSVEQVVQMCFSGDYTKDEMIGFTTKKGGMAAYIGTNDLKEAEKRILEGDNEAALIVDAMAYQIAKEIGAMGAVMEFRVDGIVLTGGLAYSSRFTGAIKNYVSGLAPVYVYPGEDEMRALAEGALRVLAGEEKALEYI